ncbi:MAG: DUF2436 domain-containing protein [Bacteroidales bacterium]|nr:DUF2436 domain-containing protein [Bacteroidales bacterium]MBQ6101254.1 DUF2436 domain-containing protein [Bacteroidales bacterium]
MRNKLFLFLMLALFGSTSFLRADEVVIGDGTSTSYYVPFNSLWGYSFVEQVYLADEIGMAGTINSISFNMSETADAFTSEFDIFMKNVERTQFASNTDFESVTASNLVYSGSITFQPGWTTITLNAPFAYDGTSNLMIGVHEKTSGYSTRYFYYTAVEGGLISGHSDSTDPNPYDMSTYGGTTYIQNYRANIMIDITPGGSGGGTVSGELTVHDGEQTNSYVPVYGFYGDAYLKCEMVYPAAELAQMAGASINSIKFYATTPADEAWTSTWQVFVAEVADATISDFYGPGTVVYEGTLDGTLEEMEIVFDAPYTYNGGNLLIGVYNIATGNYKSVTWAGETVADASVQGYNYSSLSGITASQRNFLPKTTFYYESGSGPVPPVPTDLVAITPNPFDMGYRPTNGWMEPMVMRIHNGLETSVTMTGNMSNTSGVNAFVMSEEINEVVLESGEDFTVEVDINRNAADGEYAEQFTLFYINNDRDITLVPVTATFYTAGEADIVETAKTLSLSYTGGVANFSHTPADIHPNYFGSQDNFANDAVYQFTLAQDALFSVNGGTFIGIYNKVLDFHPTTAVEPVAMTVTGSMENQILVAGDYYMIVAGDNLTTVEGTVEQLPAPSELTAVSPADGATEVEAPVTLVWTGGDNAAEYQVLFGTSPTNMDIALDWTVVDENYGSYTINSLDNNTQYFWQIKARNSNGTVQTTRFGFTTSLTKPHTVTATPEEIFVDGSTLIKWKHSSGTMGDLDETQIGSGANTNSYLPTYNLYNYSLSEQIYTSEELGGTAGYINSISFHPVGDITRNLKVYIANTDKETFTGGSDWVTMTAENLVYEGNVAMVANTWVTINFNEPFEYEGENIILAVTDHTGTWTSLIQYSVFDAANQAINVYQDSAPYSALAPAGSGTVRAFKNQIIINKDDRGLTANRDFLYYNVYYGDVKANDEPIYEKQYLLTNLPYNVNPGHEVSVTAVYEEGESQFSAPVIVKVSGYGTFTGTVTELMSGYPIEGVNVKFVGKDEFNNNVAFEGTTNANGIYTINDVKAGNYIGTATFEGMEPSVSEPVTLAYEGTETVNFVMHEVYKPVLSVVAEEMDPELARVRWSLNVDIPVPTPGGPTPGGGSASSFTEGFEGGMPADWTVVDGNNDGYTWCLTSAIPSTWTYYASMSLDWYRTGSNAICSGSYINGVGALTPNEYLVMGQQTLVPGSTLTFWAAATDASYPADHFGVFVSDDANDWTSVQEWTLTGKGTRNGGRESRDGNGAKLGTWHQFTADLSAYAGQKYIAIRHFNCNDQYIMCVDDIELSSAKGTRDVFTYDVYRAAILTEEGEPLNVADIEDPTPYYIGTVAGTDTLYADFAWANQEPGLYQYGVAANYPDPNRGNREDEFTVYEGTQTNNHVPMYVFYFDDWTRSQFVIPADDLESIAGSTISALKFYTTSSNMPYTTVSTFDFYMKEVDYTTISAYETKESCELVYSGTGDFVTAGEGGMITITFNTPYTYNGGNLLIGCENTSDSGYKNIYFYGTTVTGASISGSNSSSTSGATATQQNFIPQTTFVYEAGSAGGNDNPYTPVVWSNVLPKDIETTVVLNAQVPDASAEGVTVRFDNTFENTTFTFTLDETGTDTITDFRKGEYLVTFNLDGYTSNINSVAYSIWDDTEITAVFEEIFKPVTSINASRTGYVTWDAIIPVDSRVAEYYIVTLDGAEYAETAFNFIQIDEEDLTVGQTYEVGVAVMYTTGISPTVYTTFTYADCESAAHQVEDLEATNEPGNTNVTLAWNGATPTPPTPPTPPTGDVVVKLTAHNVWGDGTGYQMLLDNTHSLFGTTIPTSGALSTNCSGNEGIYSQFSHKIPTNADGNCSTSNMVLDGTVEITIPAGTYDWCITNPTPGDRIWIAAANGNVGGRYDDYVFEGGHTYEFTVSMYGSNDGVDVTITGGKAMYQPNMNIANTDVRVADVVVERTLVNAGVGFGTVTSPTDDGNWYYYDNGSNYDAIGLSAGGGFYWGIMFPAGMLEGNRLTKISYFDSTPSAGTVTIFQGGSSAPQTTLYTQQYSTTGSEQIVEIEMGEPVEIDNTQNIWVVMHNTSGQYVASYDGASPGQTNGSWLSTDGSTWYESLYAATSGSYGGNWNIRAYVESGSGPAPSALVPNKYNIFFDGELVGATANSTFTYDAADFAEHEYVVIWVDADYLESCVVEGENLINYAAAPLGVAENMVNTTIYPNPTDGEIRINANNMVRISIVNTLGQVVYDKAVNGNEAIINMAQFGNGVYMVNIATENGSSVKRVIVNK